MTSIINYGLNLIMPEQSIKIHHNDRPWVNSSLKSLINRRQKALASGDITLFKLLRNKVNRERKRCRKLYTIKQKFAIYVTLNPKIGGVR